MRIVLCVTGSIAAIESVKLVRELRRQGADVTCFMSDAACKILHPNAMEFATGKKVITELTGAIEHVKFAQADLILVAPATANLISKLTYKIADNPISTLLITAFGYSTPIIFVPSMHDSMYAAVLPNIEKLKKEGVTFIDPKKEEGKAKFPNIHDITLQALKSTSEGKLRGKKVLVSAGGTYEKIDVVRGITNQSSGRMGLEIAKQAFIQGADVTVITGKVEVPIPNLFKRIMVDSTKEMEGELTKVIPHNDLFISAAAVSDFTVESTSAGETGKISSDNELSIYLKPTPKLLDNVKKINPDIVLVGFKAEYDVSDEELLLSARKRMKTSNADFIVANDIAVEGAGFGSDKNQVIIVDGDTVTVPLTSKAEIAQKIIEKVVETMG